LDVLRKKQELRSLRVASSRHTICVKTAPLGKDIALLLFLRQ
jgi:hypothetical protein